MAAERSRKDRFKEVLSNREAEDSRLEIDPFADIKYPPGSYKPVHREAHMLGQERSMGKSRKADRVRRTKKE
ncbi:MAG: hypothetical protein M1835_002285 [Candelina submexicana]|nr:MAG: hypothetical protein M1835_002285 [Candelina submexicana]